MERARKTLKPRPFKRPRPAWTRIPRNKDTGYTDPLPETDPHVAALRAKGHRGPVYPAEAFVPPSNRHPGRTHGTPYRRIKILGLEPAKLGVPARLKYTHTTRKTRNVRRPGKVRELLLNREIISAIFPGISPVMRAELLGEF